MEGTTGAEPLRAARRERPLALVVDDDFDMRAVVALALSRAGFDVEEACDGEGILDAFAARDRVVPDLVVSDVQMGRRSGIAALEALRRLGIETPVVLVSGCDDGTKDRARALGADAVLDKPLDLDELRRVVLALVPDAPTDA